MEITTPEQVSSKQWPLPDSKYCTLTVESLSTLLCFVIPLRPEQLEPINLESKFYRLKESQKHYYEWAKSYEDKGYSYIISKLCSLLPFYYLDLCCYICREWFGCKASQENVYIWFWKPMLVQDTWYQQLLFKETDMSSIR